LLGLARGAGVGGGLTLIGLDALGAGIGRFEDTRRLAATIAQVIELGAPHLAALEHFDAIDHRRVDREHAFHAFAIGNLADRETLHDPRARTRDHHAFIGLDAFLFAF